MIRLPESNAPPLVAVLDDDLPFLRSMGRLLRSAGYVTVTFESASAFFAFLATRLPRCVVMDIHMPGMNGLQVRERLQAAGYLLPVIFVTAYDTVQTRDQAQKAGCAGFLLKPFRQDTLLEAVRLATA